MRFARTSRLRALTMVCLGTWACFAGSATVLAQNVSGYPARSPAQRQARPLPAGSQQAGFTQTGFPQANPAYTPRSEPTPTFPPAAAQPSRQGLVVNGREAAAVARETSNTCVVAILGAVQQPGVYQFDRHSVEPIDLIRAAGGPTPAASGSLQVIRMGARVPQQRSAFLTPQLKLPLETNDLVVLHASESHVARPTEENAPVLDALGRPTYNNSPARSPNSGSGEALIPSRIGILGVADHPLLFELHPEQSNLAAVLSRLNQDANRQGSVLVLTPGQPQSIVAWGDSGTVALKDGSLVLFKGDEIDADALPEFPAPRRVGPARPTTAGTTAAGPTRTEENRAGGPVVLNSPFSQRAAALSAANPANGLPVANLGEPAPLAQVAPGMIAQAGNREVEQRDVRPTRGPRMDVNREGDLARPNGGLVEAAPGMATRPHPTDRSNRRPVMRVAGNPSADGYSADLTIPTPDEPALPGEGFPGEANSGEGMPTLAAPEESTNALHEEPIRIPTKARISVMDESQLDRIPAPANLGAGDFVGERLPPAPGTDIDPMTAGRSIELQGIIVAALALAGVLIGLWVAAQPHRVVARPPVVVQTPLFDRLERLLANSIPIQEEATPLPGDINLYGRLVPMADHYLIDTPQQTPAPHFAEPAPRSAPAVRTPSTATQPTPPAGSVAPPTGGAGKVVRLDGSHPGGARTNAREPGLLERALLGKQSSTQGPQS